MDGGDVEQYPEEHREGQGGLGGRRAENGDDHRHHHACRVRGASGVIFVDLSIKIEVSIRVLNMKLKNE